MDWELENHFGPLKWYCLPSVHHSLAALTAAFPVSYPIAPGITMLTVPDTCRENQSDPWGRIINTSVDVESLIRKENLEIIVSWVHIMEIDKTEMPLSFNLPNGLLWLLSIYQMVCFHLVYFYFYFF